MRGKITERKIFFYTKSGKNKAIFLKQGTKVEMYFYIKKKGSRIEINDIRHITVIKGGEI